jgi:tRNA1Val (adenine37-N6)-methyltransferase
MFAEDALTSDGFLGGALSIWQPKDGYRAAMDPVLLAAAVPARRGETVLELGCGAGVASLCLARRVPGIGIAGIERQADYAALARRNAAENGIAFDVTTGDIARMPAALRALSFDHVIANPPYFPKGGGTPARDRGREAAQREDLALAEWLRIGLKRLRPGGWLTVIQSAERLPDLLSGLGPGAGSTAVLPVVSREGRAASRVILQTRKGGRAAFRLLAALVIHSGAEHLRDGDDQTPEARAILRDAGALNLQAGR